MRRWPVIMQDRGGKRHYVFISHSSRDTWVARRIAQEITACGGTPFLDEAGVHIGSDFEREILDSLDKAHELLVLLTPWALDRAYIWAEVGAAWSRRIPIIPVLHGLTVSDLEVRPSVPGLLKRRDMIELNEIDTYFKQLKMRVEERRSEEDSNG
jgi:TIR domain